MNTPRISGNSITYEAPIALYANSPERTHLNPRHVMIVAGSSRNSYFSSDNINYDDANPGNPGDPPNPPPKPPDNPTPNLSDITVVSKTVVYDASGKPSVTVVFKIKNSSGTALKGINARVSI